MWNILSEVESPSWLIQQDWHKTNKETKNKRGNERNRENERHSERQCLINSATLVAQWLR
jgi:hypothetical protein